MNENNANNSLAHKKWNCKYHISICVKIQMTSVFLGVVEAASSNLVTQAMITGLRIC